MTGAGRQPLVAMAQAQNRTLDREEVARFAKLAGEWWDANGPFKPLHRINPVRLTYIRDQLCRTFGRDKKAAAEPRRAHGAGYRLRRRAGGRAAWPGSAPRSPASTRRQKISTAAKAHAEGARLDIAYRAVTAEALAAEGATFDAVLVLEVVEHVPDVPLFLKRSRPW